jgi:hypothetical protein
VNKLNNVCQVTIRAEVKKDALHQKIDELKRTILWAGKPRVIVLVDEFSDTFESLITQGLIDAGFSIVEHDQIQLINKSEAIKRLLKGNDLSLSQIAKGRTADILVIGQIQIIELSNLDGLISCRADLSIKALNIPTGNVLTTQSFNEIGIDITDSGAGRKAIQKLSPRTVLCLKNELGKQLVDNNRSLQNLKMSKKD